MTIDKILVRGALAAMLGLGFAAAPLSAAHARPAGAATVSYGDPDDGGEIRVVAFGDPDDGGEIHAL